MIRFEWDEQKNESNRRKHLIGFETAILVFDDPGCVMFFERVERGEERWQAIGAVENEFILMVAHTYSSEDSDEVIRIISARRATRQERRLYAKTIRSAAN